MSSFTSLTSLGPVKQGSLVDANDVNRSLLAQYKRLSDDDALKRTHFFMGRFENTYIPQDRITKLTPIINMARFYARQILGPELDFMKMGFWFNEMPPGSQTSLHTHEEFDEKLSAVYYIQATENSGNLLVHHENQAIALKPAAGKIYLFEPQLPHEVEKNKSDILRLSVAFNFGH